MLEPSHRLVVGYSAHRHEEDAHAHDVAADFTSPMFVLIAHQTMCAGKMGDVRRLSKRLAHPLDDIIDSLPRVLLPQLFWRGDVVDVYRQQGDGVITESIFRLLRACLAPVY